MAMEIAYFTTVMSVSNNDPVFAHRHNSSNPWDRATDSNPYSRLSPLQEASSTMANTAQPPQAFPLGMDEVERLVKTLYDPGHAKKISETEATLRILQRSPQGWEIGDALLNSQDENVRFFGALTFTVKINADS
jgi:hypothetical protein